MRCIYPIDSELANRWREIEAKGFVSRGWRFRVVELGGGRFPQFYVETPGQVLAQMRSALYAPQESKDPVIALGALMRVHCRRTRKGRNGQARVQWESHANLCSMASWVTVGLPAD